MMYSDVYYTAILIQAVQSTNSYLCSRTISCKKENNHIPKDRYLLIEPILIVLSNTHRTTGIPTKLAAHTQLGTS